MSQTIRERGKKVFQTLKENSVKGIQAIAAATGIPKSSVYRHQQAIVRRNQHPD
ncbi:MAG: helix-turn-helix domain-containing protein [Pseudanabaenales cyanobacterium]|nr:helix-turn-helix domain-containing protein [Pseudanabaenales cyanobacterium]